MCLTLWTVACSRIAAYGVRQVKNWSSDNQLIGPWFGEGWDSLDYDNDKNMEPPFLHRLYCYIFLFILGRKWSAI